jgi:hypothetical protein
MEVELGENSVPVMVARAVVDKVSENEQCMFLSRLCRI